MGLYDTIVSEYSLPDLPFEVAQTHAFQTKNLDCLMKKYTITKDGLLFREEEDNEQSFIRTTRKITFYTNYPNYGWIEYEVVFEKGQLKSIERRFR